MFFVAKQLFRENILWQKNLTLDKRVSEKLFMQHEFSDVKILSEDKTIPWHHK